MTNKYRLLASLMGAESLDTVAQVQHEDLPEASKEVTELKTQLALSEATTDVKESEQLVDEFFKEEAAKAEAIEELEEVVAGVEGLFAGEFSPKAYDALMNQAQRAAKRAGVVFPAKVEGCESMTSASVYLETRAGLEGFMDSVKEKAGDIKKFIIDLYRFIIEVLKNQFGVAKKQSDEVNELIKLAKAKNGPLNETIAVGKWNGLLDVENQGLPTDKAYRNMLEAVKSVDELNVREIALDSLEKGKAALRKFSVTIEHLKGDTTDVKLDNGVAKLKKLELGAVRVMIDVPAANTPILTGRDLVNALHIIRTDKQILSDKVKMTDMMPAYYKNTNTVIQALEDMKKVIDELGKIYQKQIRALDNERDLVLSGIGIETAGEANYRSVIRNLMDAKRKVSKETNGALRAVMEAHMRCIRGHL